MTRPVNVVNMENVARCAAAAFLGGCGGIGTAFTRTAVNVVNVGNVAGALWHGRDLFFEHVLAGQQAFLELGDGLISGEQGVFLSFSFAKDAKFCDGRRAAAASGERRARDVPRDVHRLRGGRVNVAERLLAADVCATHEPMSLLEKLASHEGIALAQNKVGAPEAGREVHMFSAGACFAAISTNKTGV
ncbi:MAG: hypothetical protein KF821_09120 [Anaerolineales bacterium]|nr:hypothetical protein [Anaerolineales bacterium]